MATYTTSRVAGFGAWIKDVPIIGAPIDAAATFVRSSKIIVRHPVRWIDILKIKTEPNTREAIKFLLAGIVVSYLLLVPAMASEGADLPQALFVVHTSIKMLFCFVVLHYLMRWLGSRASLSTTISMWCYSNGFFFPIIIVLYIPLILATGVWILDMDYSTLSDPEKLQAFQAATMTTNVMISQLSLIVFSLLGTILQFRWFKAIYDVSWKRVIGGVFGGILIAGIILMFVLIPALRLFDTFILIALKYV